MITYLTRLSVAIAMIAICITANAETPELNSGQQVTADDATEIQTVAHHKKQKCVPDPCCDDDCKHHGGRCDKGKCGKSGKMCKCDRCRVTLLDRLRSRCCRLGNPLNWGMGMNKHGHNGRVGSGPKGCGGKGCPPFGVYQMVYPVNPDYCDPRNRNVHAAQGYGVPMAVPLAPVVRHQYNYSWGVPASRLTPISNPAPHMPYGGGYGNGYGYGPGPGAGYCPQCQQQGVVVHGAE